MRVRLRESRFNTMRLAALDKPECDTMLIKKEAGR
jgi:hypothetical protein